MSRIVVLVNSLTGDLYKHTYEDSNMDYIPVFESVEEARGYVQSIEEYGVVKKGELSLKIMKLTDWRINYDYS